MTDLPSSDFIGHEPCPVCGSSDALARYTDGHGHCFSCRHYVPADGAGEPTTKRKGTSMTFTPIQGEVMALSKRGLSEETCSKWGYRVAEYSDKPVQVADYYTPDGSALVAQKVRFANKDFVCLGNLKEAGLFGQHLWRDGGKMIVVTEGELDALSVSHLQGNKWPVVSVPNGASGAKKAIAAQLGWLAGFDSVIFMFDNDEPGRAAATECAAILPPGKAKIASLPLKDASDMLVAGRGKELIDAMWGAKAYRPDGIVTLSDVRVKALAKPESGLPWFLNRLTELTYGRRLGEVYFFGAGTGVGKTDLFTQQIEYDINVLNEKVGLIYLEQQPQETAKRIAGKAAGKRFHVPDGSWTQEELVETWDMLEKSNRIFMYDHFGVTDWALLREHIRFLAHSEGIRLFYLDHLTALAASADDERKALERIMAEIGGLVKELNICLHGISHLATPEGKPHEEGGRVMIRHFKGSRSIGFWSHFMFGLERNQQAEDEEERKTITFRVLKDRYTGNATGQVLYLGYDIATGLLFEKAEVNPFGTTPESTKDDGRAF